MRLCKCSPRLANLPQTALNVRVESTKASPLGLSTSQAAQALGVSLGTVRRWSDLGHLESYRTPGGQRRFSREQIQTFVDSLHSDGRPLAEHSAS